MSLDILSAAIGGAAQDSADHAQFGVNTGTAPFLGKIAGLGDSFMNATNRVDPVTGAVAVNAAYTPGAQILPSRGFCAMLAALSGGQLLLESVPAANQGIGGDTTGPNPTFNTPGIITRVPAIIGYKPWICPLNGGTNDINYGVPKETIIANKVATIDMLRAAGIVVPALTISTRGDDSYGTPANGPSYRRQALWVNHKLREYAVGKSDVIVVDLDKYCANITNGQYVPFWVAGDHLHPTGRPSYQIAADIWDAVKSRVPVNDFLPTNMADIYNAADNPTGNLAPNVGAPNAMMLTTLGPGYNNNLAGISSGTIASNWVNIDPVGVAGTITGSIVYSIAPRANANLGNMQVVTWTGIGGGTSGLSPLGIQGSIPIGGAAIMQPGQVWQFIAEIVDWTPGDGFLCIYADMTETDGSTTGNNLRNSYGEPISFDRQGANRTGQPHVLRCAPTRIRPANGVNARTLAVRAGVMCNVTGTQADGTTTTSGQVKIGRCVLVRRMDLE